MPAKKSETRESEHKKPRKAAARKTAGKRPKARKEPAIEIEEKPAAKQEGKEAAVPVHHEKLLAVVRIRGLVGVKKDIISTLLMLRLDRVNHCVIVPKNPNFEGMLEKAKYFITWGEIDKETLEKLVAKRGRLAGDERITDVSRAKETAQMILSGKKVAETGIKPVFRLSPPSKGYRSIKSLYPKGSLGYRGVKINELLKRMI